MIRLTRLNGSNFFLNCELIETIEAVPDSVITTITGKKLVVTETIEVIVEKVVQYKSKILMTARMCEVE